MNKELETIKYLLEQCPNETIKKDLLDIEITLKKQKRQLALIGEILVDVSKGNYADINDAINEIREVLEDE